MYVYRKSQEKESALLHAYVVTEFLTVDHSCARKHFDRNYSGLSEILNFLKNSKSTTFSFTISDFAVFKHFSKTHCTVPPEIDQSG